MLRRHLRDVWYSLDSLQGRFTSPRKAKAQLARLSSVCAVDFPTLPDTSDMDIPAYFNTLTELDRWSSKHVPLAGVLPYVPRSDDNGKGQGKLLVCHDYKGGYTESPSELSYTFNFWDVCESFIYFSHHRVTIPPPGWINSAHRQGVKMLGVLIFEHKESAEDLLRLTTGRIPSGNTAPAGPALSFQQGTLPVSPHYARILADLAKDRGFDGYLLNVEWHLEGGPQQARALEAWITLLDQELKAKVGPHAETIWYDSVTTSGRLHWQDRLNNHNLPFFLASTAVFTNYTWPAFFPALSASFLLSLPPTLQPAPQKPKTLSDVYTGVDVWGRGSHGGGGFGSYKALQHSDPRGLGLSAALFGPAWTWESEQDKPGWDWAQWWAYERRLWVGTEKEGEVVDVPDAPLRRGELPCLHGSFVPVSDFFTRRPPPDPRDLPFFTTFSPGVGFTWFVAGKKVLDKPGGWTDVDKQTSLGNLLWPRPVPKWENVELSDPLPTASTRLLHGDAFNGGSSVHVKLEGPGSTDENAFFRCFAVPVQSLALTAGQSYDAVMIYKSSSTTAEVEVGLCARLTAGAISADDTTAIQEDSGPDVDPFENLNGWHRASLRFIPTATESGTRGIVAELGLVLGVVAEDPTQPYDVSVQIGQICVYSTPNDGIVPQRCRVLWAQCTAKHPKTGEEAETSDAAKQTHVLSWEIAVQCIPPAHVGHTTVEEPRLPWVLDRSPTSFPRFVYSNIYALSRVPSSGIPPRPEDAQYIGSSGREGLENRFALDRYAQPEALCIGPLRIYVQGVTDKGQVLPWEQCAYVDVD